MAEFDEILAALEEEDPDAAKKLKERLGKVDELEQQSRLKDRHLKLATDKRYREMFPRAMMKFDKGKLSLPDDTSEDALISALKDTEEELAEYGVPIPGQTSREAAPTESLAENKRDPSQAFGEPVGGSSHTPERDLVSEFKEAIAGSTVTDRLKAASIMKEMQLAGMQHDGTIKQLARDMSAQPIREKGLV
jgi:hypothetical protein